MLSRSEGRFEFFQQPGLAFERHGKREQVRGRAGRSIRGRRVTRASIADLLLDLGSRFLRPLRAARSDDDGFARSRPAQRQTPPGGPVPPRIAIGRLKQTPQPVLVRCVNVSRGSLDVESRVGGVAFGGNAAGFENQRLELFRDWCTAPRLLRPRAKYFLPSGCRRNRWRRPAGKAATSLRFNFTHETWMLLMDPASTTAPGRESSGVRRESARSAPGPAETAACSDAQSPAERIP